MKGYCEKHKCESKVIFFADGKWTINCPRCNEEDEYKEKIISELARVAEYFKMLQRTQQEAGRYVFDSFKRYENICLDAMEVLNDDLKQYRGTNLFPENPIKKRGATHQ